MPTATDTNSWPAGRIVHLGGGCLAINDHDHQVKIIPNTIEGHTLTFNTASYGHLYSDLHSRSFTVIGVDFYTHLMQVDGRSPPDWRAFTNTGQTVWPSEETAQKWKEIAHAAFKREYGDLWDIASRIGHQLRVCSWRLRQISEAYHQQMIAVVQNRDFAADKRFEDGYTWLAYLSLQSFLIDACVLRDYLAEFAGSFILVQKYKLGDVKARSMSSLIKKVVNKIAESDPITDELKVITSEGGWLKLLGEYRDLVVHSAPLLHAKQRLFAVTEVIRSADSTTVPAVRLPLPPTPGDILASRASGEHFESFSKQFERYIEAIKSGGPTTDGLQYCSESLGHLSVLAALIAGHSPLGPETISFDSSNIIGPIRISS